jgi:hypothetical protein
VAGSAGVVGSGGCEECWPSGLAGYFTDFRCLRLARVLMIWNHLNLLLALEADRMNHNAEAKMTAIASRAKAVIGMPESPFRKSNCHHLVACAILDAER